MKTPDVIELDPRDDEAVARVNDSAETQLVTVKDGVDLPMIAAFRLLAAKLQSRHPILLKDVLSQAAANDEARMTNDEASSNAQMTKSSSGFRHSFVIQRQSLGSFVIRHFFTLCSSPPPTLARSFAMELATRSWCKAKKRPDNRCV